MRRPTLQSIVDVRLLAEQGSRMRMVQPAESQSLRDFAACFRQSPRDAQPAHCMTSHSGPAGRRRARFSPSALTSPLAYPLTRTLRWQPVYPAASPGSPNPRYIRSHGMCHCTRCISKKCASKKYCSFKDNIMRFTDRKTNTPRLMNAGIGSNRVSQMSLSDASVSTDCASGSISLESLSSPRGLRDLYLIRSSRTPCDAYCGPSLNVIDLDSASSDEDYGRVNCNNFRLPEMAEPRRTISSVKGVKRKVLYDEGVYVGSWKKAPRAPLLECPRRSTSRYRERSTNTNSSHYMANQDQGLCPQPPYAVYPPAHACRVTHSPPCCNPIRLPRRVISSKYKLK